MYRITEQSFYKYLKCPSWIARERARDERVRDALMRKLQDDGLLRKNELALLENRPHKEVQSEDVDEAATETLKLMKQGAETIYKGVLVHEHWVGRPDVLERVEGKSNLGDYYYVAVDIKRSRHLKDEYKFQGVFYADILEQITGTRPVLGYVMHANGTIENYFIEEFYTRYKLTLDSIERILEGEEEAHFLTSGCKQSPYFSECKTETHECNDLSRINRIWRSEMRSLHEAGIETVDDLADASTDRLEKVSGMSMDRLYVLQQQAIAIVENRVIRLGQVDLPEEPDIALVIDVEADPLRDVDYLFGVLVVDGDSHTYHQFLADRPEKEEQAWQEFISFLEQYAGANIYHYGWFEVDVFRKLGEKYGVSDNVKRMFDEQMIDLLSRMREAVIFPMSFYSLKDIAKHLGFEWRTKNASGLKSVLWYEEWLEEGDEDVLNDIVEYNEDDVLATWYVRNWVLGKL